MSDDFLSRLRKVDEGEPPEPEETFDETWCKGVAHELLDQFRRVFKFHRARFAKNDDDVWVCSVDTDGEAGYIFASFIMKLKDTVGVEVGAGTSSERLYTDFHDFPASANATDRVTEYLKSQFEKCAQKLKDERII